MTDLLNKFKKVIEVGNITKASEELNISQPALTMSLNKLEKDLDAHLLVRSKKGVFPTEIGEKVYEYSNIIHGNLESLQKEVAQIAEKKSCEIHCGMIDHIADFYLDNALETLGDKININIHVNNSKSLLDLLKKGGVDFAFITSPTNKNELNNIQVTSIMSDPMSLYLPKNSKYTKEEIFKNLITYNPESNTFKTIDEKLRSIGIGPEYVNYSTSPRLISKLCLQGRGVAILPDAYVVKSELEKKLKKVRTSELNISREIVLVSNKYSFISPSAEKFIESIRS